MHIRGLLNGNVVAFNSAKYPDAWRSTTIMRCSIEVKAKWFYANIVAFTARRSHMSETRVGDNNHS